MACVEKGFSIPLGLEIEACEPPVTVRALKFDGLEHRRWTARLLRREESLLVLEGVFEEEVRHALLGTIEAGTVSLEYYWLDRWYNVFRFALPTGELRNFYCNVNTPPTFDGSVLSFVDLDMDILVAPDLSYRILDEEEFEENALRYRYPATVRQRAREALHELLALLAERRFPFDESA